MVVSNNVFLFLIFFGFILIFSILLLPRRKLLEEKREKLLHTEHCFAIWYFGTIAYSGIFMTKRISFYDDYFVVAGMLIKKINYTEIKSASFKKGWFSKSVFINLKNGQSLSFNPANIQKVQMLIESHISQNMGKYAA